MEKIQEIQHSVEMRKVWNTPSGKTPQTSGPPRGPAQLSQDDARPFHRELCISSDAAYGDQMSIMASQGGSPAEANDSAGRRPTVGVAEVRMSCYLDFIVPLRRCSDDQMSVCLSYTDVDHRTHNTVPIEEESQQKKLVKTKIDVQQMILDRMRKIQEIQHSVELKKRNTEKKKSASVELFTDLIHSFERCQYDLLKMIEEQQKAAEKQAEDLIKELQQEITDLKRRNTELEQLSHTDKQIFSSLYSRPQRNWTEISINSDVNVLPMNKALTLVKKTYETLNKELSQNVLKCVQKFAVDVTLDPDTANPYLILSDDGKQSM
ncbi:hypothetical protein Q8A67_016978 [Cirrhinus molitorella]|uniref:Uncharacterized protein n=1 Tax=Cirrhinus molitorella TaxID=172907 RepID=A0AA88TIH4_9TELE|nr:hypothetical protein Q8A67_016978 [Cirrhinus molitorella]